MWFLPSRCWQSFWDDAIRNLKQNMEKYCDFRCSSLVIFRGRIWKEHAYTLSPSGLNPIYEWLRNTLHLLCYCDLLEYEMQSKAVIWSHMQGDQPPASLMQAMWCLPRQGLSEPLVEKHDCSEEPSSGGTLCAQSGPRPHFFSSSLTKRFTWVICKFNNCGLKSCYFAGLTPSILALFISTPEFGASSNKKSREILSASPHLPDLGSHTVSSSHPLPQMEGLSLQWGRDTQRSSGPLSSSGTIMLLREAFTA